MGFGGGDGGAREQATVGLIRCVMYVLCAGDRRRRARTVGGCGRSDRRRRSVVGGGAERIGGKLPPWCGCEEWCSRWVGVSACRGWGVFVWGLIGGERESHCGGAVDGDVHGWGGGVCSVSCLRWLYGSGARWRNSGCLWDSGGSGAEWSVVADGCVGGVCQEGLRVRSELYCVCRKPYDEDQAMIACDQCREWYHYSCLGLAEPESERGEGACAGQQDGGEFVCPGCEQAQRSGLEGCAGDLEPASHDKRAR